MSEIATRAAQAGLDGAKPGQPSVPPIVTASTWTYPDMAALDAALGDERAGYVYSRNAAPTQEALEAALTALEGGGGAAVYASGMAALHSALLVAGAKPGARIVAASELYGVTQTLLNFLTETAGLTVDRVNVRDLAAVEAALTEAPQNAPGKVLIFEVLSNPLCRVADVSALTALAQRYGFTTIVDSTFTTPYLIQSLALGADFVMHSLTKYIGGHGDVLGGAVIARDSTQAAALRANRKLLGANLGPFDAYLALRGLRTLPLRVREQCRLAATLAQWLADQPRVAQVYYPGLPASPDHALAARLLRPSYFGAMLAFDLTEVAAVFPFLEKLRLVRRLTTLGDVTSAVSYPAQSSHRALTPEQRAALGISDRCVRLSAGIEDPADVLADLAQALEA